MWVKLDPKLEYFALVKELVSLVETAPRMLYTHNDFILQEVEDKGVESMELSRRLQKLVNQDHPLHQ